MQLGIFAKECDAAHVIHIAVRACPQHQFPDHQTVVQDRVIAAQGLNHGRVKPACGLHLSAIGKCIDRPTDEADRGIIGAPGNR